MTKTKKEKKTECVVCGNFFEYTTSKPKACKNCKPFLDRAKSIFDSKKRKPVLFEDAVHFAIHLRDFIILIVGVIILVINYF